MIRALLVSLALMTACTKTPAANSDASQPPAPPVAVTGPRVTFPDGFVVAVEIAADDELRAQGLMYRDHLKPGQGMLFFFQRDGEYPFWMKNTMIPLDIIWIDANRRVVHIKESVPPCKVDDCPSYAPNAVARYVLEIAAGESRKHSLRIGDELKFDQTEHVTPR